MNFSQLLEKYENGSATPEEQRLVEEELEKNEAINDYLSRQLLSDGGLKGGLLNENSSPAPDTREVRRAVSRRFWKMTLLSFLMVVVLILTVWYIGIPWYGGRFYDPLKPAEGVPDLRDGASEYQPYWESFTPLYLNAHAFTELHCPGWILWDAKASPDGPGRYQIQINSGNSFGDRSQFTTRIVEGEQEKGAGVTAFYTSQLPSMGVFYDAGSHNSYWEDDNGVLHTEQSEDSRAFYRDALPELPESAYLSAYVSFPEDVTVAELMELEEQWGGCALRWAAVRTGDGEYFDEMGFNISAGGAVIETTPEFEEQFPSFSILSNSGDQSPEAYETHFKTLLRYMTHQQDFLKALAPVNNYHVSQYEEALQYVEREGVTIYGAYVCGKRDDMIRLEQRSEINSFFVDEMKLSLVG